MNNRKCLATTTLEDIMKESNKPLCTIILNWILQIEMIMVVLLEYSHTTYNHWYYNFQKC